jgi:uncharacterized membrane protein YphA (DoxX/SURF4 family)
VRGAHLLALLSGGAFIVYGIGCLTAPSMATDFERFGLERLRVFTGVLEVMGGLGLVVGLWSPPVLAAAAAGLTLLMVGAIGARLRQGDGVLLSLPAALLLLVNGYLCVSALRAG